ncbi:MAG: ATP-binding protein [Candidatus Baltobacteraceae bacterium]
MSERGAVQEQMDLMLSAVNAAGDAIVVYGIDPDGGLRLTYANAAFYEQTGYEPAEVIGRTLESFRARMPDDEGMKAARQAIAQGRAVKTEVCSYRKDGSSFWNQVTLQPIRDAAGRIAHWISVERDVTESVERESSLEDLNARLVALGGAARDLFGALDLAALTQRFAQAVRELVQGTLSVHALESAPFADELLARAAASSGTITGEDKKRAALCAGGSFVIEVCAQRVLRDADIVAIELLAQYFAIAARNASLVAEIEEQRNAVLELNQVKTDLIAMLAHDFKGPLTNILGYTDLTAEMGEVNESQQEYLDSIRRAALRLTDLATDTLALSSLERNEIDLADEDVDLAGLLRDVAAGNERRSIELEMRADPAVRGDARRLRQVFSNLLQNAVKYSPGGEPVRVRLSSSAEHALVEVSDRGIGIPQHDLARVFERFTRASNARKLRIPGTGFGLFLCGQIVGMHGGRIEVQSREGEGSTFRVLLPLAGHEHMTRPMRIAVLESESEARSFITHALREAGLRTRLLHSIAALLEEDIFQTDRIVIDLDAVPFAPQARRAVERFAQAHHAGVIVVGSDPPPFDPSVNVLRKPYLMRDLVRAVQSGTPIRSAPE